MGAGCLFAFAWRDFWRRTGIGVLHGFVPNLSCMLAFGAAPVPAQKSVPLFGPQLCTNSRTKEKDRDCYAPALYPPSLS
jgi:hypothetical protein